MMKKLYQKYKSIFWYGVSGVITTAVNFIVYWICVHKIGINVLTGSVIGWILSVLTAYLTNRAWVFENCAAGFMQKLVELVKFYACRAGTGGADLAGMWLFVTILQFPDMPVKVVLNIVIIILNYIFSKVFVFRNSGASG